METDDGQPLLTSKELLVALTDADLKGWIKQTEVNGEEHFRLTTEGSVAAQRLLLTMPPLTRLIVTLHGKDVFEGVYEEEE